MPAVEPAAYVIEPHAALAIARVEELPREMLHDVRHARKLRDGRVAIANRGTSQVFFFDSAGAYVDAIGGTGDWPGAFRMRVPSPAAGGDVAFLGAFADGASCC